MQTWITAQKLKFSIKNFFDKYNQIQFPADLVSFTEEILNGKLQFSGSKLCCFQKGQFFLSLVEIASFSFPRKIFLKRKWTITTLLEELGDQTKFEWFCSEIMFLLLYYVGRGVTGLKIGFEPASIFDTSQLRCNAIRSSDNILILIIF